MTNLFHKSLNITAALLILLGVIASMPFESNQVAALESGYGTVTNIWDGDTFEITWDSGATHPSTTIRVAGLDTNEVAEGECLADAATTRLEELIPIGSSVKLVAEDPTSSSQTRALRHVFYGPGYVNNLAIKMIAEGMGLPASFAEEPSYKYWYFKYGEEAKVAERGLWLPGVCGGAPSSWPEVETYVNYDAEGNDFANVNGEYIELRNKGAATLDMSDWTIRGSARLNGHTHTIPSGASVQPGGIHRIYSGYGTSTATKTYLGLDEPWLNNETDVVYIRDLDLNMRAAKFWPCTSTCEPWKSLVVEDVQYDAPGNDATNPNGEWIRLRNVGDTTIDLNNWRVKESGKFYRFAVGDKIYPGQRLIIKIGTGISTSSIKYWGNQSGILNNSGKDYVQVLNPDSWEMDCYTWGNTDECGAQSVRAAVRMFVNFDASGNDVTNPNGEWVAIQNTSNKSIWLTNYKLYTPGHTFTFPVGSMIGPNSYLRVRIGSGTHTRYNKYWGNSGGILSNSGDFLQLRSSGDAVIAEHSWPCSISCGYSYGLTIDRVNYNAPGNDAKNPNGEWIRIKNTSAARQDLQNWKIKVGPYQLVSVASRPMDPGESITIYIGKGKNTKTRMYWGKSKGILYNTGSREVELLNPYRHDTKCYSWGKGSC